MERRKDFLRATRGNVAMIFAFAFVLIVGSAGGGVELFNAVSARSSMQDALDSAVLAGIRAGTTAQMSSSASAAFNGNIPSTLTGATQTYGAASASSGSVTNLTFTGEASVEVPTKVMGLFGIDSMTVHAKSVAVAEKAGTPAGPCIYVLDPSGSQALLVNSGAQVAASACEIDVKSTANPAAIFNSGSSLAFSKLCIQGANVTQNSTTVANLKTGCAAQGDPYAGTLPTPASSTCTYSNLNYSAATQNLSPGVYCGWFNFNNSSAQVNFAPGVYVIKGGGWNVNGGTWTGSGVTFYFADTSKIQFNSGISANLSAPTSGTYKNLLFYEAAGLSKTQFVLNDSVSNQLTGLIWLPSRELTLNAKSGIQSDALTMVVWRLILNNTTWKLASQGGSSSSGGTLSKVRLAT